MKRGILLTLIILLVATVSVYAASVHLKGGKKADPLFTDNGLTLTASGALSGLGNGDILITLDAYADVTAFCTNQGGNQAPGQNPAPITVTGTQFIPEDEIDKNGNTPFAVVTNPPDTPIPGAPDCPNPNWSEDITELAFTSAVITVEQGGVVVLTVDCEFASSTENGSVSKADVMCTQM